MRDLNVKKLNSGSFKITFFFGCILSLKGDMYRKKFAFQFYFYILQISLAHIGVDYVSYFAVSYVFMSNQWLWSFK